MTSSFHITLLLYVNVYVFVFIQPAFGLFFFVFLEFRLALIQLAVSSSKPDNLVNAALKIKEAAKKGAHVVALPVSLFLPVFLFILWFVKIKTQIF